MADRRIAFHRSSPPYEPGDVAGFPAVHARRLVDRGVASYVDPEAAPDFAAMGRAEMVRYAIDVLGFEGEPPAEVTDDELRAALVAQAGGPAGTDADENADGEQPEAGGKASGKAK